MQLTMKENPAMDASGQRTVWGAYNSEDAAVLANRYDQVSEEVISEIADQIGDPRLLEVSGVVEIVQRYLERSFTQIRGMAIDIAASPLSILFFNEQEKRVQRIVTKETELLHKPVEKLFLRAKSILGINSLLDKHYGLQVTTGCSCCLIAVATKDLGKLFNSEYYQSREQFGRRFDSDVLTVTSDLFKVDSVADVPVSVFDSTADFHEPEVKSYLRFWEVNHSVIQQNIFHPDLAGTIEEVQNFLAPRKLSQFAA